MKPETRPGPARKVIQYEPYNTPRGGKKAKVTLECGHVKDGYRAWLGTRWSYCGECRR